MSYPDFERRVGEGLRDLAGDAPPMPEVANRALAQVARRRRVPAGVVYALSAVVALAAAAVSIPLLVQPSNDTATSSDPVVIDSYTKRTDDGSDVAYTTAGDSTDFRQTPYKWAMPQGERLAVLRRARDASDELGILSRDGTGGDPRWFALPSPASTAFWSPDGAHLLVSLTASRVRRDAAATTGFVLVSVRTGDLVVMEPAQRARGPYQWTPDGQIVAALADHIAFFDETGEETRRLNRQGSIPVAIAVSANDELLFRPRTGPGDRYLIIDLRDQSVAREVTLDGTVLGWLCSDEVLLWDEADHELLGRDLPVADAEEPALQVFDKDVTSVWPQSSLAFDNC